MRFCDWLESVPSEPHFSQRPEFEFFADMTDDEMLAAEQELVRRVAVLGTGQDIRSAFTEFITTLASRADNDQ